MPNTTDMWDLTTTEIDETELPIELDLLQTLSGLSGIGSATVAFMVINYTIFFCWFWNILSTFNEYKALPIYHARNNHTYKLLLVFTFFMFTGLTPSLFSSFVCLPPSPLPLRTQK